MWQRPLVAAISKTPLISMPLDDFKDPQHHLRRLDQVFIESPIYFITTCTENRAPILTDPRCTEILVSEWHAARDRHGWGIGMYVIMPDHVHFFTAPTPNAVPLSRFMQAWKEWTSKRICRALEIKAPLWQREFFDHLLRSFESYEEKSRYVLENPVRAGFVNDAAEWPHRGRIVDLHHYE